MSDRTSVNHYESLKASGDSKSWISNAWTGAALTVWTPASTKKVRVRRVQISVTIKVTLAAGEGNILYLRENTSGNPLCAVLAIPDTAVAGNNFSASIDLGDGAINDTAGLAIIFQGAQTTADAGYIVTMVIQGDEE